MKLVKLTKKPKRFQIKRVKMRMRSNLKAKWISRLSLHLVLMVLSQLRQASRQIKLQSVE